MARLRLCSLGVIALPGQTVTLGGQHRLTIEHVWSRTDRGGGATPEPLCLDEHHPQLGYRFVF